VDRIE
jgi:hypothetical protein